MSPPGRVATNNSSLGRHGPFCQWTLVVSLLILISGVPSTTAAWALRTNRGPSITTTNLHYASTTASSSDPMELAKTVVNKGGCPFLDTTGEQAKGMYAIPALFGTTGTSRPILVYDDTCGLSHTMVRLLCRHDTANHVRVATYSSRVGALLTHRMPPSIQQRLNIPTTGTATTTQSMALCTPTRTYTQSGAVLQLMANFLVGTWRGKLLRYLALLSYVLPTNLRDRLYRWMAAKRSIGKNTNIAEQDQKRWISDDELVAGDNHNNINHKVPMDADIPVQKGDTVRIVWPNHNNHNNHNNPMPDPTILRDEDIESHYPHGVCLMGATGTVATVDLPLRIVLKLDKASIGIPTTNGDDATTMYAWVQPCEVQVMERAVRSKESPQA